MEQKQDNKKIAQELLDKINKKDFKIYFVLPEITDKVVSQYEMYFHAKTLKNAGYNSVILTEKSEFQKPTWFEEELTDIEHVGLDGKQFNVTAVDILVMPEVFTNVMEQTKNLPCDRIVLAQSYDAMINSLLPSVTWKNFNIKNVITTSQIFKNFIEEYFGEGFNIKTYDVGIPDYFKESKLPKKPIISFVTRNGNDIFKVTKLFFLKYPNYRWVTFEHLNDLNREDFAEKLSESFAAVWIDRISSMGTFPLECMKSNTLPIGLIPDVQPEYIVDDSGAWTNNVYNLPNLIANVLSRYLEDNIPEEIYNTMKNVSSKYNQKNSAKQLIEIYGGFINDKIKLLENVIMENKEPKIKVNK
ncbi:MAG: hypothetical protein ACOC33_00035 [bacterium]